MPEGRLGSSWARRLQSWRPSGVVSAAKADAEAKRREAMSFDFICGGGVLFESRARCGAGA
jgi:hypothetical protein